MTTSRLALVAGGVLLAIQLVPVSRTNPPATAPVAAPPEVAAILRRACFDCHSRETAWPWHAYVAPISWLVAHDVSEGREELDFSAWDRVDRKKVARKLPKEVEGDMPPWYYLPLHPTARLSPADRAVLSSWARSLDPGRQAP